MAPFLQYTFPFLFFLVISSSQAQNSFRPKALVIPVRKDANTLQYVTNITQRTPPVPVQLVVDLGGQFVWIDCESGYTSSTYRPAVCRSAQCSLANSLFCSDCNGTPGPLCNNNSCSLSPQNGVTEFITGGDVTMDVLTLKSTDGFNPGVTVNVPRFIFACTRSFLLEGLASGTTGIAGFGKTRIALPSQLAAAFSFDRKFAMCLSSETASPGVIFFGDGPYSFFQGGGDVSQTFRYTRMINNPVSTNGVALRNEPSFEYFMGVTAITISGKDLPINSSLLSIASNGVGGTKFSTVAPYGILESTIYKTFTETFISEAAAMNITRVASVAPFGACFSSNSIVSIRGRLQVPSVNLVLQNRSVVWPIYATNLLVQAAEGVSCLAFVDASSIEDVAINPLASIILGGYQLEDNFIQFDLATSRIGFTSMLYDYTTRCSSFRS
ncbi:hypothetical protein AQUCO_01700414v1 [Aquilegia coerulea]|uniref:Peptidase A1 domain-containing protein n=1 Tax=Aquilegia coerulea TaxID=218851 RepID=A0A2G5DMS9_AQUCA|nr:hypothetical protein AQUCO_01700414v1 [Aquilegia coerulea]